MDSRTPILKDSLMDSKNLITMGLRILIMNQIKMDSRINLDSRTVIVRDSN